MSTRFARRVAVTLAMVLVAASTLAASTPVQAAQRRTPALFVAQPAPADELPQPPAADSAPLPPPPMNAGLPDVAVRSRVGSPGSWRAVGSDGQLVDVVRGMWVSLTADGLLVGRIATTTSGQTSVVPGEAIMVHFISSGRIVASAPTDAQGQFTVAGLTPGVYSLIAIGRPGFLAFSLMVLPHGQAEVQLRGEDGLLARFQPEVQAELSIDAMAAGPTFATLRNLITQYYPEMQISEVDEADFVRGIEDDLGEDAAGEAAPPWLSGMRDLVDNPRPSAPATSIENRPISLTANGSLYGRLYGIQRITGRPKLVRNANVFLIRNDRVIGRTSVNEQGVFEIRGVQPGLYSLVAAGQDGFGAIGIELVEPVADPQASAGRGDQFVALLNGEPSGVGMGLIDNPQDLGAGIGANGQGDGGEGQAGAGAADGAGEGDGGTGGGGGGGGGGTSGGPDFAGAAAAAALFAAAASGGDDGGGFFSPLPTVRTPDLLQ